MLHETKLDYLNKYPNIDTKLVQNLVDDLGTKYIQLIADFVNFNKNFDLNKFKYYVKIIDVLRDKKILPSNINGFTKGGAILPTVKLHDFDINLKQTIIDHFIMKSSKELESIISPHINYLFENNLEIDYKLLYGFFKELIKYKKDYDLELAVLNTNQHSKDLQEQLHDYVSKFSEKANVSGLIEGTDYKKVYDKGLIEIFQIFTKKAADQLGYKGNPNIDTKGWCVTWKDASYFNNYIDSGKNGFFIYNHRYPDPKVDYRGLLAVWTDRDPKTAELRLYEFKNSEQRPICGMFNKNSYPCISSAEKQDWSIILALGIPLSVFDQEFKGKLTGYELALKRVKLALQENSTELNISGIDLETIPPEIGQLKNLTYLFCDDNELQKLPPEIGQLKNLTHLFCGGNRLRELPKEIGQLQNLIHLSCGDNQLHELPKELDQLQNLMNLWCYSNQLHELPKEIGQLQNLIVLSCERNQLRKLPPEISQLKKLTTLHCGKNKLHNLPTELLSLNLTSFTSDFGNDLEEAIRESNLQESCIQIITKWKSFLE